MAAVGLSAHTHSAVGGRVGGASTLGAVPAAQHRPAACSRPEERPVRISAAAAAPPTRRRRASQQCRAAAGNGSSNGSSCNGSNPRTADVALPAPPSSSETARTVVDLVAHGTLCTTGEDGTPLGTYASYVLDEGGQPVLRLRADAVHTANLRRSPRCSLFVQPGEHPTRLLARVTLIGEVEPVPEEVAAKAADLHNALHAGNVGVDAPRPSDLHYRLKVDRVFYVGELAGASQAEVISGDEYRGAEADPLRTCAVALVHHMNTNRAEDVLRMSCDALRQPLEDMFYAELLWVDKAGVYLQAVDQSGASEVLRLPFMRPVEDERDARSQLTILAQQAWERERTWNPLLATVNLGVDEVLPSQLASQLVVDNNNN